MEDSGGSEVILESVLHSVDLAREQGLDYISVKPGEVAEQSGLDRSSSTPMICRILESQWFEERAGVTLVHRVGIRGTPETIYLFILEGLQPNRGSPGLWRRLCFWRMQISPLERSALLLAGVALLLALLALWWADKIGTEIGWLIG